MRKPTYREQRKNYSEQGTKLDERPKKRNRQKITHKVRGRRRQRPRTNSLMRKRLERQPKSKKKSAKPLPKANQVSAPACDRGSGINRLIPKSLGAADALDGALDRQPCRIRSRAALQRIALFASC